MSTVHVATLPVKVGDLVHSINGEDASRLPLRELIKELKSLAMPVEIGFSTLTETNGRINSTLASLPATHNKVYSSGGSSVPTARQRQPMIKSDHGE